MDAAVHVFARAGLFATPITEVAERAGISPAYVFRLFDSKVGVFVVAVRRCYSLIADALVAGAGRAGSSEAPAILAAMSEAYADLVRDRDLLTLQVHAQSATGEPAVREAVRAGMAELVTAVQDRSGADDDAVQGFFARGQLWNLVVAAGVDEVDQGWARALTSGLERLAPDR